MSKSRRSNQDEHSSFSSAPFPNGIGDFENQCEFCQKTFMKHYLVRHQKLYCKAKYSEQELKNFKASLPVRLKLQNSKSEKKSLVTKRKAGKMRKEQRTLSDERDIQKANYETIFQILESSKDKFERQPVSESVEMDLHKLPVILKCLDQLQLTSFTVNDIRDHLETRFEIGCSRLKFYNRITTTLHRHVRDNTPKKIEKIDVGKWKLKQISGANRTHESHEPVPKTGCTSSPPYFDIFEEHKKNSSDINSDPPGHPSPEDLTNIRDILNSLLNTLQRLKPNDLN